MQTHMRYIKTLRLTNFRSYKTLDLELDGRPVVLFGPNGAGKTNLLEAVSFLSPGRGLRRARLEDIGHRNITAQAHKGNDIHRHETPLSETSNSQKAWGVTAHLAPFSLSETIADTPPETQEPIKIGVGQVPDFPKRRVMRLNGQTIKGPDLARLMNLIWLTPAQDRLFTGPASDRRKFLDRFTLAHDPQHGAHSLRYEKARRERNRLLADKVTDAHWYSALEVDLAHFGSLIAQARVKTLHVLKRQIEKRPEGVFPKADIRLDGRYETLAINGLNPSELETTIKEDLRRERVVDMRAGRTLQGVHKTELCVMYQPKDMPASECSTGEQKALLIGLTLAHCHAFKDHAPSLLLDEVAAHLDIDRRAALMEECLALKSQVFMTGTDGNLFKALGDHAQYFKIETHKLIEVQASILDDSKALNAKLRPYKKP